MLLKLLVFEQNGKSNGIFAIVPAITYTKKDCEKKNKKRILETFRFDREYGFDKNPSKDISTVKFYYTPFMEKQAKYKVLPYQMTDTIRVIDAFICIGSRFGLEPLSVIVEVCESNCGSNPIWANIYYVANSEIPAIVIKVISRIIFIEKKHLL